MWVEQIDIRGFRRLSTTVELSRGLNLVHGKNEAGKSTLFDALVCGLFGFSRAERRGPDSTQVLSRPWTHSQHALQLVLRETSHRDALRVEWSLGDHRVSVYDNFTGEDLSGAVGKVAGDVDLGSWLLGIELAEFRDVCCLDQATIKPVHGSENLKQALQASVASGRAEVGHEQAEQLLRDFLRGRIGLDLRSMSPKAEGPLGRLVRKRDDAVERLEAARAEREAITEVASGLPDLRDREARREQEEKRLTQRLLLSRYEVTRDRLERVHRKECESKDRPEKSQSFPGEQVSAIHRDRLRIDELEHELQQARSVAERYASEVADLTGRRDSLVRERDSLEAYAELDRGAEDRLRSLRSRREQVAARLATPEAEPADVTPDPELERFRDEREHLRQIAGGGGVHNAWLAVAAVVAIASLAIGALVSPVGLGGLALAVVIYLYSRQAGGGEELSEALARYGASSLEELERRAEADSERVSEARAAERIRLEQREGDECAAREIDAELDKLLRDVYPDGHGASPADGVAAYLGALEKHDAFTRLRAEAAEVESTLRERSEVARAVERQESEQEAIQQRLGVHYEALGIDASDLAEAASALDAGEAKAASNRERVRVASAAADALTDLLGGESIAELTARVENLRSELEQHRARQGQLADKAFDTDDVQTELDRARGELRDARAERHALEGEVARRDAESGDPATLEALIADLDPRIRTMEDARDAVELARGELVEAASETYREFAPALRAALERYMLKITGERYAEAFVDEELGIKVRAPETGEVVGTERLSRGTQDQIFLIERLEIARMLDRTTGGAPLLLDDPFDRFDSERLRLGLEVFNEVAQQRQVVLFSENDHVVDAVQSVCSGCNLIELPGPAAKAA